jgi:predicted ATPase
MLTGEKFFQGESPPAVMMAHFSRLMLPETWPEGVPAGGADILKTTLARQPGDRYTSAGEMVEALTRLVEQQRTPTPLLPRTPAPLAPITPAPLHNLPAQPTPLVGREAELAVLDEFIADPGVRLVTIVGPGGTGKTRLALAAAGRLLIQPAAGAVPGIVDHIVPAVAEALNFSFFEGGAPRQQLLDYLHEKQLLLIMDNFEHLLAGVELVTDILQSGPKVRILATSREWLQLHEEQVYPIRGLEYPDWKTATTSAGNEDAAQPEYGAEYTAVKLFLQCARRIQPNFRLGADDLIHVIHICDLVEGLPLGLELAATWVDILSLADIAAEIRQSLDFLETGVRNVPDRHRSMRAVFDASWQQLNQAERRLLAQLSVFRGGFTRAAAQSVTVASLRLLATLRTKSLLQYNKATDRYQIHELVRQYGAEKLAEDPGQEREVLNRHSAYYCATLQEREAGLIGSEQQTVLAEIEADLENTRLAWNWAVEQGQVERLEQVIDSLGHFYERQGYYEEGEAACRQAGEELVPLASGDGLRVLAKILTWQSVFRRRLGHSELERQLLQESLALLDSPELAGHDTQLERAFVLQKMGEATYYSDLEEARGFLMESLALCQATGDRWRTAEVLRSLGKVAWGLGAFGEAKQFAQESLTIRRALDDRKGLANSLDVLVWVALSQGELEEGEGYVRESYAIRQAIGDQTALSKGLNELSLMLILRGKFAEAHSLLEKSLRIEKELGNRLYLNTMNIRLGQAQVHLGWYEQAQATARLAVTIARELGLQAHLAGALELLGWVRIVEEAYAEARQVLEQSAAIYREIGQQAPLAWVLATLGYAVRGLGQGDIVRQHLTDALGMGTKFRNFEALVQALPLTALLLADRGKPEQAVELYALVSGHRFVGDSCWFEDVVGRHIAVVAATLPPEVVAAAQERGRARDLWTTAEELLVELAGIG